MPAEATTEVEEVAALIEQASREAINAATAFTDVTALCENPNGEPLRLHDARALLGHAYIARRWARWSVDESEKAIEHLTQQVFLAEETEQFARIDAERGRDHA